MELVLSQGSLAREIIARGNSSEKSFWASDNKELLVSENNHPFA
jgi:hypothetical protein